MVSTNNCEPRSREMSANGTKTQCEALSSMIASICYDPRQKEIFKANGAGILGRTNNDDVAT